MTITTAELSALDDRAATADHRFFTTMAMAALTVVFMGFATSYYLWPITRATHYPTGRPISPAFPLIVHVHAVGFSAWILLLVAQVSLVAAGRTSTHRRLGMAGVWLLPILVLTGLVTAVRGARDGWNPAAAAFADSLGFLIVGLVDLVVFAVLATAGLAFRRRPGVHKRLMLLATLGGLMWPAITRMPIVAGPFLPMFALLSALVLAPAARDFWNGSTHRWLSLLVGLSILASLVLRPALAATAAWRAFAAWLVN